METSFKAGVDEPGKVIVPGRLFGEMSRSLGAGQVSVFGGEGEVEIGSGRGQFRVKSLAPDDYPALPIEDRATSETLGIDRSGFNAARQQRCRRWFGPRRRTSPARS